MNQKEIKWLPLRLNIVPLLDKQARAVMQLYLATRKDILEGDILSIQKLTAIKEEVRDRIKEIDAFYARNSMDQRAKYIYAARSVLAKIVEQRNDFQQISLYGGEQVWVGETPAKTNNENSFGVSPNATQRKSTTPQQSSKNITSRTPLQQDRHPHFSDSAREPEVMRLSDLRGNTGRSSKSPMIVKQEAKNERGTHRKTEQGAVKRAGKRIQQVMVLEREKVEASERIEKNAYDINKSFKDLSELVFTIKMTKQEYNEFMRLKRKNNHA